MVGLKLLKMKKLNILIIMASVGVFALTSCFDDPGTDILFNDQWFVEIQEATTSGGLDITKSYTRTLNGLGIRDSIRVNLAGAQRPDAVNVSFEVDNTSTAVSGTHYSMITTGTSITIDPSKSFTFIYFTVLDDNFTTLGLAGQVKLRFNLTAADVPLSENFKSFTRTIRVN